MAAPSVSELDICNFAFEGRLELVRASLEKNPELINKTDSSKRSALHWACSAGRDDVVRLLLSKGAQVSRSTVELCIMRLCQGERFKSPILTKSITVRLET